MDDDVMICGIMMSGVHAYYFNPLRFKAFKIKWNNGQIYVTNQAIQSGI